KFPIRDAQGDITRIGAIGINVTERKRAEQEIQKLNEDLERRVEERTAELRAAQDTLVQNERLSTLGQLTATVSHELRNPLGVIRTSAFTLRKALPERGPRVERTLDRIERNVVRCDRIIDELLDFTRISELEPQPTSLDVWLEETLNEQTLPTGVALRLAFDRPNIAVSFDHDRFRRAIINIFDNACQAMIGVANEDTDSKENTLTVRTRESAGRIEVIFLDTGPGIPPDVYKKIFEPLYSTKGFGVGLGLPVVKHIMEQHGGGIEIDSEEGRGTRVCLWLPTGPPTR
ncbi:MAG: ATP-binding protein, partial [Alphaproteobacteria bacterium]|nr:ATP-binding protein [Alphaproteobacteria bacterium]